MKIKQDKSAFLDKLELRPEYIKEAKKIMKQKKIHLGSVDNLRKRIK